MCLDGGEEKMNASLWLAAAAAWISFKLGFLYPEDRALATSLVDAMRAFAAYPV